MGENMGDGFSLAGHPARETPLRRLHNEPPKFQPEVTQNEEGLGAHRTFYFFFFFFLHLPYASLTDFFLIFFLRTKFRFSRKVLA